MKRGIKFQPMPNPPIDGVSSYGIKLDNGKFLGIPVKVNADHAGVADAQGFLAKCIVVGPAWFRLDDRVKQAVLYHEAQHCLGYHLEKRLLLLAAMAIPPLVMLPWTILATVISCLVIYGCWEWEGKRQEKEADAFAVQQGYGVEMANFLRAHHRSMPTLFYPDYEARMANIEREMKEKQ